MRSKLNGAIGLLIAGCVAVLMVVLVSGGCVYEPCDCPCLSDGGADGGADAGNDGGD